MNKAFNSIKKGLVEAIDYSKGKNVKVRKFQPVNVDVQKVRNNLEMTQEEFSARLGISISTLRHWERGDRKPSGPALVLLNLIMNDPEAIMSSLAA
ncbi:MAG: helix-turn-helix domain-containing protein [Candidatus Brocadiales bacterium]|nr:helix-turn-helix domain-containing protein [Candidatus Brocadiales bacterium]